VIASGPSADRIAVHQRLTAADAQRDESSAIAIHNSEFESLIWPLASGATGIKVTVHANASIERPVTLRNVVGLLRGSDPVLKDTYALVTAHYDHIGVKPDGDGDRIYNGANDDASGTASVIEIASALATLHPRPKRSIAFIALFGEETGLLGSRYYGAHPLFPLARTVADVNLEQLGRTDSLEGPKIASASFTGFDFSDLPSIFEKAGQKTGVKVYKDDQRSDEFFSRSDNQALADVGVPAHTLCVAFEFPDYHGVADEWPKLDYENMAKVDRMVALGLLMIADSDAVPRWNAGDAKATRYEKAWERLHESANPAQ
jgi:Zn-dependent M28 family amino/carboxypeptidase